MVPAQLGSIAHPWCKYLPTTQWGDLLPTTLHLHPIPLGTEMVALPWWGWWGSARRSQLAFCSMWFYLRISTVQNSFAVTTGKGQPFPLVFPHALSMTFSLCLGLSLCAWSLLVNSLAFVSLGRGLVLSANIFSAHGFLSYFFFFFFGRNLVSGSRILFSLLLFAL